MASYGHDANGFNIQNVRELASGTARWPAIIDLQRPEHRWKQEVVEQVVGSLTAGDLSARLRNSSKKMEEVARASIDVTAAAVDASLQAQLAAMAAVIARLQTARSAVAAESAGLGRAKRRLVAMGAHLEKHLVLNASRQKARLSRPARERTLDEVSRTLAAQDTLLRRLGAQVRGALEAVQQEVGRLEGVGAALAKDLEDKMMAHEVDAAVLGVPRIEAASRVTPPSGRVLPPADPSNALAAAAASCSGGGSALDPPAGPPPAGVSSKSSKVAGTMGALVARDPSRAPFKTAASWQGSTQRRIDEANVCIQTAQRLRAATRQLLAQAVESCRTADAAVEQQMGERAAEVGDAAGALKGRLAAIAAERQRAAEQRDKLKAALQDTEAPLAQLQARVAMRGQRPTGELVDDVVEAALTAEALALHQATAGLAAKLAAVEEQLGALDVAAAALNASLEDKTAAKELEARVAALDGRRGTGVPRTPSVLSVATANSVVYTSLGPSASRLGTPSPPPHHHPAGSSPLGPPCAASISRAAGHAQDDAVSVASLARSAAQQHSGKQHPGEGGSMVSGATSVRSSVLLALQAQLQEAQAERQALQQQLESLKQEGGAKPQGPTAAAAAPQKTGGRLAAGAGAAAGAATGKAAAQGVGSSVGSRPMTTAALARIASRN